MRLFVGFIGAGDNQHRIELDAREARVTARWNELSADAQSSHSPCTTYMGDILFFNELYQAYPGLYHLPVVIKKRDPEDIHAACLYSDLTSTYCAHRLIQPKSGRKALCHEISHVIQGIESWAAGSSVSHEFFAHARCWYAELLLEQNPLSGSRYYQRGRLYDTSHDYAPRDHKMLLDFCGVVVRKPDNYVYPPAIDRLKNRRLKQFLSDLQACANANYLGTAGEVEAQEVEARLDWTSTMRAHKKPRHAHSREVMRSLIGEENYGVNFEPRKPCQQEEDAIYKYGLRPAIPALPTRKRRLFDLVFRL